MAGSQASNQNLTTWPNYTTDWPSSSYDSTTWINVTTQYFNGTNGTDKLPAMLVRDTAAYKTSIAILIWTLPPIILFGTTGNIFSFILMLQREMRQTSTYFYLAILAVADTMVLFVSAFKTWIRTWSNFELLHISDGSCKTFMFLTYFSLHLSGWLIVAVTVERFIVVWFPLKATSICNTTRARFTTVIIVLVLFLLNVHLFWTAELVSNPGTGDKNCGMLQDNELLYKDVVPWLHLAVYSFVPSCALLIFNTLIIVSLIRHRQVVVSQMTKDDRRTRYNHRKLAITLLWVSFVWICTTTPSALYTVLPLRPSSVEEMGMLLLVKVICYIILYINHSINFLLYCATGQNFRCEFTRLVRKLCRSKKKPKPKLTFRASRSGSGQETSFPLMDAMYINSGSKRSKSSSSYS